MWRPYYFLTDDNLTYWTPLIASASRSLVGGQTPFFNSFLIGKGFDLLRDPNSLWMWNPLFLLLARLSQTRWVLALCDLTASFHILLAATSFTALGLQLRSQNKLKISDKRLALLSLSFAFSGYSLVVGASWVMFLANVAALPLFLLGLTHSRARTGLVLVSLATLYSLTMGHLSPFIFTLLFLGMFVAFVAVQTRSFDVLGRYLGGLSLGTIAICPLLWLAWQGFSASPRHLSLPLSETMTSSLDPLSQIFSFVGGYAGVQLLEVSRIRDADAVQAFPVCALAWLALWIFKRPKDEAGVELNPARHVLENAALLVIPTVMIFIARPLFLAQLMSHLPLFRSLRWPFRESFVLLFLVHFLLLFRVQLLSRRVFGRVAFAGAAFFVVGFVAFAPHSFAPMPVDRSLLLSGQSEKFWAQIRPHLRPGDKIIAVVPEDTIVHLNSVPFSLLGSYNYPALLGVPGASGYTTPGSGQVRVAGQSPYHWSGTFSPEQADFILKREPKIWAVRLLSLKPLRIELQNGNRRFPLQVPPISAQSLRP